MRGGERQTSLLMEGLGRRGWLNYLVCRAGAPFSHSSGLPAERVFPINLAGEIDLIAGWKIGQLARKVGTSIIHCHTAEAHSLGIFARLVSGRKLVVTRRVDFPLKSHLFSYLKYRFPEHIIAISRRIEEILLKAGIPQERVSLVPSGVVLSEEAPLDSAKQLRRELNLGEGDRIIGTVAALVGHKDYPTLLRAFRLVLQKYPLSWLLCLGEGDELPGMRELAGELGISERVKFLGFRKEIGAFFRLFEVYVQSSRLEGLCSSLIEAMYHKLPIAATSAGGIPDLIEHEVTGLLSSPENPSALAHNIIRLMDNRELGCRLGENARLKSLDFSAEKMVERTEQMYMKVLGG